MNNRANGVLKIISQCIVLHWVAVRRILSEFALHCPCVGARS
ncbi:Uncharacterised protein [Vibrio cholerae]|nr:Uncharacterised protein [Vibrio cholerae]